MTQDPTSGSETSATHEGRLRVGFETPRVSDHAGAGRGDGPIHDGVLAPFAGESLDYLGFRATMDRDATGAPRVRVWRLEESGGEGDSIELGELLMDASVSLTVGSHRYQQYIAYIDRGGGEGELWRLPLAWHRATRRWIHMNGAFVEPEGEPGLLRDYNRHLSRWNDNCIFCHNTDPVPGLAGAGASFETRVGELGIGCEACHGSGQAHVERHRGNPLRRLLARGEGDASISNPGRMSPARASEVCARCHGQRIGRDIASVLREGDGFVPGDVLARTSRPILAATTVPGVEGLDGSDGAPPFAARFWPDGTPRLSAYEYQGLLLSPCWQPDPPESDAAEEGLGCNHCHDMHGDSPDGQLRTGRSGEGACAGCHDPGRRSPGHARHREALDGAAGRGSKAVVDCLDCHMPRITYGLLEGMRSHRITNPDPAMLLGRHDQPDACTQCHVDRSRAWAAAGSEALGFATEAAVGAWGSVGAGASGPDTTPQVVLDLLGGDPIQRNLAAHALAQPRATGALAQRMGWIVEGLEDEYPSVRWFAWRGLQSLVGQLPTADGQARSALLNVLAEYDYMGPVADRIEVVVEIDTLLERSFGAARVRAPLAEDEARRQALIEGRVGLEIYIGE